MIIRKVRDGDASELVEIYRYYVENTAITYEYEVPSVEEFEKRILSITEKYPYLVAEEEGKLLGYCYAGVFKNRAAYDWDVETTIYVRYDKHGKGIGKALYTALEDALKKMGITNLNACIAYPDQDDEYLTQDSRHFHEHLGYQLVGQFHNCGYKFNRWYHMIWMEKMIGEHVSKQPAIKKYNEIED